jgi:hypothetical protein
MGFFCFFFLAFLQRPHPRHFIYTALTPVPPLLRKNTRKTDRCLCVLDRVKFCAQSFILFSGGRCVVWSFCVVGKDGAAEGCCPSHDGATTPLARPPGRVAQARGHPETQPCNRRCPWSLGGRAGRETRTRRRRRQGRGPLRRSTLTRGTFFPPPRPPPSKPPHHHDNSRRLLPGRQHLPPAHLD